jgi:hypothetical protein
MLVGMVLGAAFAVSATAAAQAPPQPTSPPTIEGRFQVGQTLTAGNGSWTNSPTSFTYQWQRCNSSGCANITGATQRTYRLTTADVDRRVRVLVTASNADGKATANSAPSPVISDAAAPRNTERPVISGTPQVGQTLTVSNGRWTGGVTSFSYQWLQCDAAGNSCVAVSGATGRTYGVRSSDVGRTLRARVTAQNAAGRTSVTTDRTSAVQDAPGTTVTTEGNRAPTIRFLSLKVRSNRVYVRFRVCDDSGRVTVIARDQLARRLAYTRRFRVEPTPCGVYARNWRLIPRFRAHGRFVVSLRAIDGSRRLSRLVVRSVIR